MTLNHAPDTVVSIGVGTGDTGQFLDRDKDGNYWLTDYHSNQHIRIVWPEALVAVLQHELDEAAS